MPIMGGDSTLNLQNLVNKDNINKPNISTDINGNINLKKIADGTLLKGMITNVSGDKIEARTELGNKFFARLAENTILNIGENREFIVNNQKGNVSLRLVEKTVNTLLNEKLSSLLEEFDIPINQKTLSFASKLIDSSMPVTKENIQQVAKAVNLLEQQGSSKNNEDKAILLIKNEMPITEENINILNSLTTGDKSVRGNLQNILVQLKDMENSDLSRNIKTILGIEEQIKNHKSIEESKSISDNEMVMKGENIEQSDTKKSPQISDMKSHLQKNSALFTLNEVDELLDTLKHTISSGKTDIEVLEKKLSLGKSIDKLVYKLNLEDEMAELQDKIKEAINLIDGDDTEIGRKIRVELQEIDKKLAFANEIKNTMYFNIPINLNGQDTHLRVNVHKEKKVKKTDEEPISAVISLDTANLGIFETYIQKNKKNLNFQFRLERENTEALIRQNMAQLETLLSPYGFKIDSISFRRIGETFEIYDDDKAYSVEFGTVDTSSAKRINFDMRG